MGASAGTTAGRPRKNSSHDETNFQAALTGSEISRPHAHRFQQMATLTDREIAKVIAQAKQSGKELTTAVILRAAKDKANAKRNGQLVASKNGCTVEDLSTLSGIKTIYADPPWQYGNQGTRAATNNHYPTLDIDGICALPVCDIVAKQAILFLWTTNGFLIDALTRVMPAWGFEFKSSIIWCKPQIGIGNYVRNAHEFLLIGSGSYDEYTLTRLTDEQAAEYLER